MDSDEAFVCEGYEQDGGMEMRKYNFYFGWDFFSVEVAVGSSYVSF